MKWEKPVYGKIILDGDEMFFKCEGCGTTNYWCISDKGDKYPTKCLNSGTKAPWILQEGTGRR
ncbi:MAG: hypothetical protein DRJ03_11650 [Chloroflexi bacterium]|nr:MAG: hypothetical protein DRJ03_11650 [Chloroflexota bacterium]